MINSITSWSMAGYRPSARQAESRELRKHEPHPVAALGTGLEFGEHHVDHWGLGGDEAVKGVRVGHACMIPSFGVAVSHRQASRSVAGGAAALARANFVRRSTMQDAGRDA